MGSKGDSDGSLKLKSRVEDRSLQVLHKSFVRPCTPTAPENRWLPFAHLDRNWLQFYTPVLCVYRAKHSLESFSSVGEQLRKSLERVLPLFYPLAGRVKTSSSEEVPGTVCDDTGAVFVEACIEAELDELEYEEDFQPSFLLTGMKEAGVGEYPRLPDDPAGRPALIVQLTHFKCGGITLASTWAHCVADGFSGFHFMKSWAELARGEKVSLVPVHERARVKPREPLILSDPFSEAYRSDFLNPKPSGHSSIIQNAETDLKSKQTAVTVQVVEIPKQLIDELKQEVESAASQTRLSRVCYVSAHLWRAITKARELPGTDLVRIWTLVEGRNKLSLPAGFFGNVIGDPFVTTTVNDLLNKPLAYSASLVATSIQHTSKDWYQDLVDWTEARKFIPFPGQVLGSDHECGMSWQNRFPYYELDFGFGPPVKSMRNACASWDGNFVILPSSRSPDNFTAMLHTTPDVMTKLLPLLHQLSHNSS